ncbi:NAD-dependent epimerase/dehydratase family protein [Helicobacter saguini]|uniref:NAD(P)-dependent oxidoreductase n=1 Tax=Helicobacter saguini TaxID=1548018 RepID=A0A347VPQ8_9HELI|nr:NAD(P)-dependent oxidoreductase [Helicobacter saguini]MWV61255.1 NAD-dependent epimerase/dehydratase family protein [Helicobacter saguini]MWV68078.1 NAD-dependent epimerase/dehydratase family protein [Helicobacter saguini]MWV70458.1 NAD-dependent epimerase/dehydratase family protein [Helicobacter saguini]MWV72359.1 NAD-dependent epimerase/dehydratase family protein [Helicobacter saguini]TLD93007.1 NAD(P)-dependent oxidoreductase [Helicobacter saguini]
MLKAIIFGANGYIGRALTKCLLSHNMQVLALARCDKKEFLIRLDSIESNNLHYQKIKNLQDFNVEKWQDFGKDSIFYNLAWKGENRLNDGDLQSQMQNINLANTALNLAKSLQSSKFINISSQEQALFSDYIHTNKWKTQDYTSNSLYYSGVKYAVFELLSLLAYMQKIDFINVRFSIPLDFNLSNDSFVSKNLRQIMQGKAFEIPKNKEPCEIISLDELCESLYFVGLKGKNKADYYLGKGEIFTLQEYFETFKKIIESRFYKSSKINNFKNLEVSEIFNPKKLYKDTGFSYKLDFFAISKQILQAYKKEK